MADSNSTITIPSDNFNDATCRLSAATALISSFAMLIEDAVGGGGEIPMTGAVLSEALYGIRTLLEDAADKLKINVGGAA